MRRVLTSLMSACIGRQVAKAQASLTSRIRAKQLDLLIARFSRNLLMQPKPLDFLIDRAAAAADEQLPQNGEASNGADDDPGELRVEAIEEANRAGDVRRFAHVLAVVAGAVRQLRVTVDCAISWHAVVARVGLGVQRHGLAQRHSFLLLVETILLSLLTPAAGLRIESRLIFIERLKLESHDRERLVLAVHAQEVEERKAALDRRGSDQ